MATQRSGFFISYTGADTAWAEWVAWQLEAAGHEAIFQGWDFRPGENFLVRMLQALDSTERTLAVVSTAYLDSVYGSDEWTAAFAHDEAGRTSLVLVMVEPVTMPRLLRPWIHIDLVGLERDAAARRLLDGLAPGRAKPAQAPRYPGGAEPVGTPSFPGHLPAVSNLAPRNRGFTGRAALLQRLRTSLAEGSATAVTQVAAVHGLGGVGKTALALEFAHRYASDYDLVWWLPAERPTTLAAGLIRLARRLGVAEEADQEETIGALWARLRGMDRWLLVYDNVERPEDLEAYRPPEGEGHVLITSRHLAWGRVAAPLRLDVLDRAESVAFLTQAGTGPDLAAADAVAAELGDLPLALEEAAAFIEETGVSLPHYLGLLRERMAEVFQLDELASSPDEVRRVATVWSMSLERVRAEAPAAQALLALCAFLAPEDIPRELPHEHAGVLPEPLAAAAADTLAYDRLVAAAARYSLLAATPAALAMHRLLQLVVRTAGGAEGERTWAQAALALLLAGFPGDPWEVASWPACQRLLPHVLEVAGHARRSGASPEGAGRLLERAASYLLARGQYGPAVPLAEEAVALTRAAVGAEHSLVGERLDTLGRVLREQGDHDGAKAALEEALAVSLATAGERSQRVAVTRSELAQVLRAVGDLDGARDQLEQAIAVTEETLGPGHPYVGTYRNNLGNTLHDLGDLDRARDQYEQALAITERTDGPADPGMASTRNNLGSVLAALGDLDGARGQYEQALAITERALGPTHPAIAVRRNNLGLLLERLGDRDGARAEVEQAVALAEQVLGPDHPDAVTYRLNLALLGGLDPVPPGDQARDHGSSVPDP